MPPSSSKGSSAGVPLGRFEGAPAPFDLLGPSEIVRAVEEGLGSRLDGTVTVYPSYINRVYGLRREDGGELVAKFYRPGRWSREAILEEHRFVRDCADAELPVAAPLELGGGGTLGELSLSGEESSARIARPPPRRKFSSPSTPRWAEGTSTPRTTRTG